MLTPGHPIEIISGIAHRGVGRIVRDNDWRAILSTPTSGDRGDRGTLTASPLASFTG